MRDYGRTEIGGFGISPADDLLYVDDVRLVKQTCSWVHVAFDDTSVAEFFDEQVDAGRQPEQFARIWVHTHPGDCAQPSAVDEKTFTRVFGRSAWALMFILAKRGQCFARLRFNDGPGGELVLPADVDYSRSFLGCDHQMWEQEYLTNVSPQQTNLVASRLSESANGSPFDEEDEWLDSWFDYTDDGDNEKETA
ncbi:MAG: hypothetical protein DWQ35_13745 [Planctomycetota bacterium]|nr:MAG: hypothetical protein DWQ35_13745 [Planctomycetota bacterium]REK25993.1 MAG: hypothetical protein DWQ42_10215 [Planctomycetota bacterium]REK46892.1 MAG: hypothetical protein DWQ46_05190 [Planctomycetota bacterium]